MDRRRFLTFAGLAAGASLTARAGALPTTRDVRKEAMEQAKRACKPLLVAWIPEDKEQAER
ncbi:MAG: hypothetical protein KDB61_15850, partial [Planctomycetes bacterium]|nr:hypothetical protein [Planctomycetota bacterium]